jgi:hypothetical protein
MSAIPWVGQDIVEFLWGGFSVNNATLNRFFALHFVLPFVLAALALMHLIALHDSAGSGNPLGVSGNYDRLPFAPYFIFKDLITIFLFIVVLSVFVFFMPNVLGDSENYVMANPMQTPPAIVPEWYLLPFYAILRSIPNKLLGVIAMFSAILIILTMPLTDLGRSRGLQFRPLSKIAFYIFVANFLVLMQLGAKHVESPFIEFGQISTVLYFAHFLIIVPVVSLLENTLVELHLKININNLVEFRFKLHKIIKVYILPFISNISFLLVITVAVITFLVCAYLFTYFIFDIDNTAYAMEAINEERINIENKLAKSHGMVTYFREQVMAADFNLKKLLRTQSNYSPEDFKSLFDETKQELMEHNRNLNSEQRRVNVLQSRLDSGDYNLETKPTTQKRSFSDN